MLLKQKYKILLFSFQQVPKIPMLKSEESSKHAELIWLNNFKFYLSEEWIRKIFSKYWRDHLLKSMLCLKIVYI